ncbi:MAG: hypothetical protein IJE08_01965 [Clostridia bacterium]|nr:hypothetical protein [Clostridia bacterium]
MNVKQPGQAQQEIYQRLAQLDEETQERISQKYYHGTRPWLAGGRPARKKRKKPEQTAEA